MLEPDVTTLYKYKPLNQYTMDIIVSDNIYYPKPARFNDPFDTKCFFRKTSEIVNRVLFKNTYVAQIVEGLQFQFSYI